VQAEGDQAEQRMERLRSLTQADGDLNIRTSIRKTKQATREGGLFR
jgi:hypothetical protein